MAAPASITMVKLTKTMSSTSRMLEADTALLGTIFQVRAIGEQRSHKDIRDTVITAWRAGWSRWKSLT